MSGNRLPSLPSSSSGLSFLPKGVKNHFTIEEAIGRAAISLATHPFDYVKILIQIGYEPLPAVPVTTIWGKKRMQYPGVFSYLGHIRRSDGVIGCYRGIGYKLTYSLLHGFIYVNSSEFVKSTIGSGSRMGTEGEEEETDTRSLLHPEKLKELLDQLMRETACKFLAIAVAYPFQVMAVRSCSQFIGRESVYNTLFGSVSDIYHNSGLRGFYVGFMPKFVGDCLVLWTTHGLIYVIKGLLPPENKSLHSYVNASINFIITSACYPFQLVSTVMICNGLPAASLESAALSGRDPYADWIECWRHLSANGQLKRGSSMFWRYQPVTAKSYANRGY